jgi:regulator of ribonuclease activity A
MPFKTADLCDEHETTVQVAAPGLSNFGGLPRFHGAIVTIKSFEDFSKVREQVNTPGKGQVLVIDNGASMRCAMLGDLLAAAAINNGWSGVVINGCIRDSSDISMMKIGVKALAANPRKGEKNGAGEVNVEVEFQGVKFRPGEFLYSDEDGIITSPSVLI